MRSILFLLVVFLCSCAENGELPVPNDNDQLVVECLANSGEKFSVKVGLSSKLNELPNQTPRDSCVVEIQIPGVGSDFLNYFSDGKGGGKYISSNLYPQPGNSYKLKVSDPVYGSVVAEDVIPFLPSGIIFSPELKVLSKETILDKEIIKYQFGCKVPISKNTNPVYYHIILSELVHNVNGKDSLRGAKIDLAIESNSNIKVLNNSSLLILGIQNSNENTIDLEIECKTSIAKDSEKLKALNTEVRAVSKNYFSYYSSIYYQIKGGGNPLENPPSLFSNVKGGLGIFGSYSVLTNSVNFP